MNLEDFQILENLKIKDALQKIDNNRKGFVCAIDSNMHRNCEAHQNAKMTLQTPASL